MAKKKLSSEEKRHLRRFAFNVTGGLSAALAGAGVVAGHPESLILLPVSIQSFRLARKRGLTKKQKRRLQKTLEHMFIGKKKKKTRKIA